MPEAVQRMINLTVKIKREYNNTPRFSGPLDWIMCKCIAELTIQRTHDSTNSRFKLEKNKLQDIHLHTFTKQCDDKI